LEYQLEPGRGIMFVNDTLQNYIETSSTVRLNSAVIAEWNMNIAENILKIGNYRFRPLSTETPEYNYISQSFSLQDSINRFYTGATDADIVVDGGYDDEDNPIAFISKRDKEKLLYSLEDCFGKFRPRSGINKLRYFDTKFSHFPNPDMTYRPRYYMASKEDPFKYWTSYRTEEGIERGIANQLLNNQYYIDDAAPFVVYKDQVPANRIVLKVQTNVGEIDMGPFQNNGSIIQDPFYGEENKTVPSKWQMQYLDSSNNWISIASFDETSTRSDGSPIFGEDGYVELFYGLKVPEKYRDSFALIEQYSSSSLVPSASGLQNGSAYLVAAGDDAGVLYIAENNDYVTVPAEYYWSIDTEDVVANTGFVTNLTNPPSFIKASNGQQYYREFQYIKGLRVVVETMNAFDSTFDLIELSPRLTVDVSERVTQFSLSKNASDLGISGMPVGQLLASTGSVELFDYDQAFFPENVNSIISQFLSQNIQFKFYEIINVPDSGFYYVPMKTMYSEELPSLNSSDRMASLELRDLFFYLESTIAPQMLIENASVSSAVSLLLDSIGFSNYSFKRNANEQEDIIPYFFIEPDSSVAEVLNEIARSTQTAMFFDELNNFIMMSKNYIMPTEEERPTDIELYGTKDLEENNLIKNESQNAKLANILDISTQDNKIYNGGSINYTTRSIQRSFATIKQGSLLDRDRTWIYKPALLWEVTGETNTKSANEEVGTQSSYSLAAIPLNSDLSSSPPSVLNGRIINNTIDLGDAIYWMTRYKGYFFANGEIIRFDAIQYNIPGLSFEQRLSEGIDDDNVWISSTQEYQKYFAKIPFNGKMYPTGLVRIYAEPNYVEIPETALLSDGPVAKHGRGQFGTEIVAHNAGLSDYWTSASYLRSCFMDSKYAFLDPQDVVIVENAELSSNDPSAVFVVDAPTALSVGMFVRKAPLAPGQLEPAVQRNEIPPRTVISEINTESSTITLSAPLSDFNVPEGETLYLNLEFYSDVPEVVQGVAGEENTIQKSSIRTGLIKDMLANRFIEEVTTNLQQPGTVQSSAFVFKGNVSSSNKRPNNYITYVYKQLDKKFKHFGTRMRIIGKVENSKYRGQSPEGSSVYYNLSNIKTGESPSISGSSGGLGVMLNPETNNGYYFEIISLSTTNDSEGETPIYNMVFYKLMRNQAAPDSTAAAIPVRLWAGIGNIQTDDGKFTGQSRMAAETNPTVYDLAVEYEDFEGGRRFYLYVNNVQVGTATDLSPLPIYNNMALFVRGNAKCMFENIYALADNYSQNTTFSLEAPAKAVFGVEEITANKSFQKYAMSGLIQSTYLSGIGQNEPPKYNIYYEEFGTIMREASYFDVRYDKAYPALSAQISPTFNKIKGYTVSGFVAGSYGAEFLVFNNTDTTLNLDSTSGNYLRIQGVTFTQESQHELSVDQYFEKISSFDENVFNLDTNVQAPLVSKRQFSDIKLSRLSQGQKFFTLEASYIQSQDAAEDLMGWFVNKIMKPRKSVGLNIFSNPMIQLGDIVKINFTSSNQFEEIASADSRFVVYSIEYKRSPRGPEMKIYLSEVKA
jgi:hypothetical protein